MKKKTVIIISTFILILYLLTNTVLAGLVDAFDGFINVENETKEELESSGGKLIGIIQIVGTTVSVGIIIIIGIRYVLGSAEQKAEYKKTMMPYLIGTILIFSFSNITQFIYTWTKENNTEGRYTGKFYVDASKIISSDTSNGKIKYEIPINLDYDAGVTSFHITVSYDYINTTGNFSWNYDFADDRFGDESVILNKYNDDTSVHITFSSLRNTGLNKNIGTFYLEADSNYQGPIWIKLSAENVSYYSPSSSEANQSGYVNLEFEDYVIYMPEN